MSTKTTTSYFITAHLFGKPRVLYGQRRKMKPWILLQFFLSKIIDVKLITFAIIFILISNNAISQPMRASIDSLEKQLAVVPKTDTTRVLLLKQLGEQHILSNPAIARRYFQEGLSLARNLNFRRGEADCLRWTGNVLKRGGQYPEALDNFLKALKISESIHDYTGISAGLGHIGDVYSEQGDHAKARSYFFRAKTIDETSHNDFELALMLVNIGKSYQKQNSLDSALLFFNQSYELVMTNRKFDFILDNLFTALGQLKADNGNDAEAMAYFRKSIPYSIALNAHANLSNTYQGIANLFKKAGQKDSCIFYGQKSLASAQKVSYVKGIMAASQLLSDVYEGVDKNEAFKYYKLAMAAKDSLFNTEKVKQVQNLGFVEQQRLQTLEDAKFEYRNKMRSYTLLSLVGAFLLVTIILFRNNRNKQKANKILQQTLSNLKSTQSQLIQSEKMASLGELTAGIAHEIQNPLNFVNNFSEVNKELLEEMNNEIGKGNMEEVKLIARDVIENQVKINHHGKRADGIVKGMLQHSRPSTGVKEPTDINALADEYFRLAYHGLRAKDKSFNAAMKSDFNESIGNINIIPQDIGRVLLNLFTNAFYAVTEKKKQSGADYEPTVSVGTKKLNDSVEIRVRDNGIGMPQKVLGKIFQPFFTTKPTGQGTGLGLSLSYDIIIKEHGGELKVETVEGEFSEFIIILPKT